MLNSLQCCTLDSFSFTLSFALIFPFRSFQLIQANRQIDTIFNQYLNLIPENMHSKFNDKLFCSFIIKQQARVERKTRGSKVQLQQQQRGKHTESNNNIYANFIDLPHATDKHNDNRDSNNNNNNRNRDSNDVAYELNERTSSTGRAHSIA